MFFSRSLKTRSYKIKDAHTYLYFLLVLERNPFALSRLDFQKNRKKIHFTKSFNDGMANQNTCWWTLDNIYNQMNQSKYFPSYNNIIITIPLSSNNNNNNKNHYKPFFFEPLCAFSYNTKIFFGRPVILLFVKLLSVEE